MRTLTVAARRVPPWGVAVGLAALAVVLAFAKYGIGSYPQWVTLYDIGSHWTDPRAGADLDAVNDYLLGNSFAAVVAGMTGLAGTRQSYGLVMLVLTLAAVVWPFLMPQVLRSRDTARLLFVLLVAGPVVALLMMWVGGYDAVTVIAACLCGLARSRWVVAVGWFLAAVNHWSMALVALVAWIVVLWFVRRRSSPSGLLSLIAISVGASAAGTAAIHLALLAWGGSTSRAAGFDLSYYDADFATRLAGALPAIAWSVLGVGWLVVAVLVWRRVPAAAVFVVLVIGATVLIQLRALDATRDTTLPLLPALFVLVVAGAKDADAMLRGWRWPVVALAAVGLPTVLVFGWQVSWVGWGLGG